MYQTLSIRSACIAACFVGLPAAGATIPLTPITNNSGISSTVASQVQIDVTDAGGGLVDIAVTNNGTVSTDFVITQFYLDDADPALLSGFDTLPTSWGDPATPPDLPAGNTVGFSGDYTADANNPQPQNGIDINESATFTMTLAGGTTFADFLDALNNEDARIGLHIQSIDPGGQSDSFVTPEPGSITLMGLAAWLISLHRRRK